MKRGKKSQVTIFIVIGIIIVITIGSIIFLSRKDQAKDSEIKPITAFIESCLEDTAKQGIKNITFLGGYYNKQELIDEETGVPFYWYLGKKHFPKLASIEDELAEYIENNINPCINNFDQFKNVGYNFELADIKADSSIGGEIKIKAIYPITITKNNFTTRLNDININFNSNFKTEYDLINQFLTEQEKYPNEMPLGYLADLAYNNDFTFEITPLNEDEILYTLLFDKEPIIYNFAVKYNWTIEQQ